MKNKTNYRNGSQYNETIFLRLRYGIKLIRHHYKRVGNGVDMPRGSSRNLRVADNCYQYLKESGPKTVTEIVEYLNTNHRVGKLGRRHTTKSKSSVTSQQVTGMMRTSPLFKIYGHTTIRYPNWGRAPMGKGAANNYKKLAQVNTCVGNVCIWNIVPVKEVVDNLLDENGQLRQHTFRKHYPRVIKYELKDRGVAF